MNDHYLDTMLSLSTGMSSAALAGLPILVIIIAAWLLITSLQRAIRAFRAFRVRIASRFDDREAVKRAETLGRVFRYLAAVVVSMIAGMAGAGRDGDLAGADPGRGRRRRSGVRLRRTKSSEGLLHCSSVRLIGCQQAAKSLLTRVSRASWVSTI